MPYDTLIANGTAVIPALGEMKADIALSGGRIAALLAPGLSVEAREVIDASGKYILPGAIDPHVHMARTGAPYDEYETETRSAAIGGVTTFFNFHRRPGGMDATFREEVAEGEKRAYIDFALHFGALTDQQVADLPHYVEQFGGTSFKYHLNYRFRKEPNHEGFKSTDDGLFYDLLSQAARFPGVVVSVHCETGEIPWRLEERLRASGAEGQAAWDAARPPCVEGNAVRTACYLAGATGAALYVVHMSTRDGLDEVRRARLVNRAPVYVETCPQYFTLHVDSGARVTQKVPPVRTKEHADAVWAAILDGTVDTIATDHGSRRKQAGDTPSVWEVGPSFPGMATMLPLLLSEGVHKRGLSLKRVAEITSYNTARIFNLFPRKGTIQVGSDADLVLVDLQQERTVDWRDLGSHSDFSLWQGWRLKGWPVRTLVRGKTVMLDGQIVGEKGYGRYQRRDLPTGARSIPAGRRAD